MWAPRIRSSLPATILTSPSGAVHRQGPAVGLEGKGPDPDVVRLRARASSSVSPTEANSGIGEDGHGQGPVIDRLAAAAGVVRGGQSLVRGLVGQELPPDEVADGVDPGNTRFQAFVRPRRIPACPSGDEGARLEDRSELGLRPVGEQDPFGLEARRASGLQARPLEDESPVGFFAGLRCRIWVRTLRPCFFRMSSSRWPISRSLPGRSRGQDLEDGDLRPEAGIDRPHLQADRARPRRRGGTWAARLEVERLGAGHDVVPSTLRNGSSAGRLPWARMTASAS